jgi:diadenosine tetraphosphate (Ap4A) HIT family hydrolase
MEALGCPGFGGVEILEIRPLSRSDAESRTRLAEAIEIACRRLDPAFRRVNIEILGNRDAFLHAHVWPRYDWEPPEFVAGPVWHYPIERWRDPSSALGPHHDRLRADLAEALDELAAAPD